MSLREGADSRNSPDLVLDRPYGDIVGKGTRENKIEKLREICGKREQSADTIKKRTKEAA